MPEKQLVAGYPSGDPPVSDQLKLFDAQASVAPEPPDIRGSAEVTDGGQYRWRLKRWWGGGLPVCWIMLNPSTADAKQNDPTLLRVIHFTRAWGYDALTVVNLYPFRSAHPRACRLWSNWESRGPDYYARDRLQQNLCIVAEEAKRSQLAIAAWGAGAWDGDWVDEVVEEVQGGRSPFPALHCLGKTAGGAPLHPLARGRHRVPDDQQPVLWRSANA